ncbi:L,D-transpeptidase YcbB [Vibrio astriarenae]|nr:L,D-transpeptidase YcbB [Vibrio sp. C7]
MKIITGCALALMTLHANAVEIEPIDPVLEASVEPIYVEGLELVYPSLVAKLERDHKQFWINPDDRMLFEEQVNLVALSGVSPLIGQRAERLQQFASDENWTAYDLMAIDTLLLYVSYVESVPEKGKEWFYESPMLVQSTEPSKESLTSLSRAIEMNALSQFIEHYRAPHSAYDDIDIALTTYVITFHSRYLSSVMTALKEPGICYLSVTLSFNAFLWPRWIHQTSI